MAPTPVTLVTGFLGSGKTTLILNLVQQLRTQNPNYRLALLKNEFGDLAVDSQLATSSAISGVQELLNGCICCNIVGEVGPALEEMYKTVKPDRIIVETSGSAFPALLAMEVNKLSRKTGNYVLDGVVNVIDVENWEGYKDTSFTAKKQAGYTDLLVFNKWETAGEDRYETCVDHVGAMDVDVATVKSRQGWVSIDLLFGTDGSLARNLTNGDFSGVDQTNGGGPEGQNGHEHDGHDHEHGHQGEVEVLSIELKGEPTACVSLKGLESLLKAAPKDEVYRIKSILTLTSRPQNSDADLPEPEQASQGRYILNWAFERWTFTPMSGSLIEHASSTDTPLRMTIITGREASRKWKKKIERGGILELEGGAQGELSVSRIL